MNHADNAKTQSVLFDESNVQTVPLIEYIRWFIDRNHPDYNLVQLPPIQRGTVWKVAQVERLWDSLLRGFPIGSFMLAPRKKGTLTRSTESRQQVRSERDGWFLLDGQQRTRALLLGFRPDKEAKARLWVDLAPPPLFDNADHNDRMFLFRLLTRAQPWGMEHNNPDHKLSEDAKRKPREKLGKARYDYEVEIDTEEFGPSWHPNPDGSWPVRVGMPVPFDALVQLCGGTGAIENFSRPSWDRVEQLVHPHWRELKGETATDDVKKHFECLLDALEARLHRWGERGPAVVTLQRFDPEEDPFVSRQHAITNSTEKKEKEKLQTGVEVLFRRVNAGGTLLAGEEMAYSLLKACWDDAYTFVDNIIQDQNVGYLMPPSSLVLAATRVALTESFDAHDARHHDIAHPSVRDFRRWISEPAPPGKKSFLDAIKDLLKPISPETEKSPGRFHTALTRFCGLVLYRDGDQADPGLPRKLVLSVSPLILHPILYWLDQRRNDNNDALEESRLGLLRYLMFSLLGILDNAKASLYAFEVLRENDQAIFPDAKIYKRWLEPGLDRNNRPRDPVALALLEPDKFETLFNIEPDGLLRGWDALFGGDDAINPYREFRRRFWAAEGPNIRHRDLLLWFQRAGLPFWFKGYNPMREDGADTPYDFDHILPRAHITESGKPLTNTNTGLDKSDHESFRSRRLLYLDAIGNLRIWPSWANRSDGRKGPDKKLRSGEDINRSAIDPGHSQFWLTASDEPFKWPESRRKAWQKAVERRTSWLYETLYNTLGYKAWLPVSPSTNGIEEGSMRVTADEEIDNGGEKING